MTLKFDKVFEQVQRMGRAVAHLTESASQRGQLALELLQTSDDLAEIHRKIAVVREKDAGYRGAAAHFEPINTRLPAPPVPPYALLVAVDGSQVYPDPHGSALYYLTNIASFVYFHGSGTLPESESEPTLYYTDADLREKNGHGAIIKNTAVNARRDVQQMETLAKVCWQYGQQDIPLIGIMDGPLLWWTSPDVPHAKQLTEEYHRAMQNFYDVHTKRRQNASLVGYVERGDSRFVIRLLHLLTLDDEDITRASLETSGEFEGLTDDWLFAKFLMPGERSAVMIQQSPQNRDYKKTIGEPFEIAFFYLNVGALGSPHVVRVEVPMWVVTADGAIDEVHSLLLDQCALTGRYPYCLTRAHEVAVVSNYEKRQLEEMITIELLKNRQHPEKSPKQISKEQTRARRRRYGQPSAKT